MTKSSTIASGIASVVSPNAASSKAAARFRSGESPGFIVAVNHRSRSSIRNPALSLGISPARISEDLPHPEEPTTARKRVR
ncbi:MAG: hypothetical protein JNK38_26720 [Acidobacteria bacterium]|nr:hypothetical protein [Acidobacteriota bacterium]